MIATDLIPLMRNATLARNVPERREAGSLSSHWLTLVLDELDCGLLIVNQLGELIHSNAAARSALDGQHPLQLQSRQLFARHNKDTRPLFDALAAAESLGRRCLLRLGDEESTVANVVVVPLNQGVAHPAVLLVLERRALCGDLSTQWFALQYCLTPTETAVLKALSAGVRPTAIAERQGVAISTVRTQIQSIRAKSGAKSIRSLLHQLAVLPPLMSALR